MFVNQFSIAVSFVCVCLFVVHTHAGQAHNQSINQSIFARVLLYQNPSLYNPRSATVKDSGLVNKLNFSLFLCSLGTKMYLFTIDQ